MLSTPYVNVSICLQNSSLSHESYIEINAKDGYFKDVYATIIHDNKEEY